MANTNSGISGNRRYSYASVLTGNTSPGSQPGRSGGVFINHPTSTTSIHYSSHPTHPSHPSRASDPTGMSGLRRSLDIHELESPPPYAGSLGRWQEGLGGLFEPRSPSFFVPSYLKHSRHVERLEARYNARERTPREAKSTRNSMTGSLSRSGSAMSLHKMVPSHRGMTYEIQEKFVPSQDEQLAPLPSRWSGHDKSSVLEVSPDGLEVKFTGQFKNGNTDDAATIRTDHPIPKECGIYYFEVMLLGKGKEGLIGIGFAGPKAALNRLPGWEPESYAYHGDDGHKFGGHSTGRDYGPTFGHMDIVGACINIKAETVFFTKNGVNLGIAFRDVKIDKVTPAIGMKKPGEQVKVNLGQEPFVFDIDGYVAKERASLLARVRGEDTSVFYPSHTEKELLQELVGRYLAHEGYTETTRAFAAEVRGNLRSLRGTEAGETTAIAFKEDPDAAVRQKIRSAVLEGRVQDAIDMTDARYPSVLRDNENIYFKLRCRKFIELIKKSTDLQPRPERPSSDLSLVRPSSTRSLATNGQAHDSQDDLVAGQMELDTDADSAALADTDPYRSLADAHVQQRNLMNEALMYGRKLQNEFKDDPRREVKKALEDTFALIAYPDARQSSLAHLLEEEGRIPVAEELNSAVLVSLGQSSSAALERLIQQTEVLCHDISAEGSGAALLNVRQHYLR